MSRIAITIWNDRISPVFESAGRIILVEVEQNHELSRSERELPVTPFHEAERGNYNRSFSPRFDEGLVCKKIERLRELDVDILVCGAISNFTAGLVSSAGIEIIGWISGYKEEVIQALIRNRIGDDGFLMPGCFGRRRRRGRRNSKDGRFRDGGNYNFNGLQERWAGGSNRNRGNRLDGNKKRD
ncbi:MAG: NifB/NifX family molybdenum-iron cluster-binding protein [Candidatus Krumholzibacteriota bacterium]|nr:NifB/NifX family molybdenum-iron cluster-binding protein [Candidatus Krumholzibacteriota bacterium]